MNRIFIVIGLLLSLLGASPIFASPLVTAQDAIDAVVKIDAGAGIGSGVVISSEKDEDGHWSTYIISNHHVVKDAIARKDVVNVEFSTYLNGSEYVGNISKTANVVAYDENMDLALLLIADYTWEAPKVADLFKEIVNLTVGEKVWAIGAGLGYPPFMTSGYLGPRGKMIDGYPQMLITADLIFGNSGGGLFHKDAKGNYEFIGIPSEVLGDSKNTIVEHMGMAIELNTIKYFLVTNKYVDLIKDLPKVPEPTK